MSLVGAANPAAKPGLRYSEYVPARYLKDYEQGLNDPTVQREQQYQIAGMHALEVDAWKRLEGSESGAAWDRLQEVGADTRALLVGARRAIEQGEEVQASMKTGELLAKVENELLPIIEQGAGEEAARRELVDLMQKRSKLIRVQQQGERTVPVEVLGVLVARIAAIISEVVTKMVPDRVLMRRLLSALITRIRIEGLPPGGDGMMKRVDAHTAKEGIEEKLKEVNANGVGGYDVPSMSTIETTGRVVD